MQFPSFIKKALRFHGETFNRCSKCFLQGFFAMGKQRSSHTFKTGLPAGQYCDLISDCRVKVTVDGGGNAHLQPESDKDPVVAFVVGTKNNNLSWRRVHDL